MARTREVFEPILITSFPLREAIDMFVPLQKEEKRQRYTSEDDRFVRISSDRRFEVGQGRDSNGRSTGSSGGAVCI